MKKKYISLLILFVTIILASGFGLARADDNEDDYENQTQAVVNSKSSSTKKTTQMVTKTIVIEPVRTVTENVLQDVNLIDSDMDGLPDTEDPHPNINEMFVVKDDNLNGVVDTFEYVAK